MPRYNTLADLKVRLFDAQDELGRQDTTIRQLRETREELKRKNGRLLAEKNELEKQLAEFVEIYRELVIAAA